MPHHWFFVNKTFYNAWSERIAPGRKIQGGAMSLESCFAAMGGDLESVRGRLRADDRIRRIVGMFPHDETFANLERAWETQSMPEAFRAAHTLKGVSRDLGFTPLFEVSNALADVLRPANEGGEVDAAAVEQLLDDVRRAYQLTLDAIEIIDE
ncbi:Hpt domain-containing protein [Eggerthellaceae bacterium zg-886]|uniref:Hpt domain-containing protein n=2 Tax=Xiamenia xianingshaonis TaxID=2682776 RepID=A0ABX0IM87_9ACTN|nr:Hpt domain-containing protein [Xiamenia xianingshaonis]